MPPKAIQKASKKVEKNQNTISKTNTKRKGVERKVTLLSFAFFEICLSRYWYFKYDDEHYEQLLNVLQLKVPN